jgi:tetratricopeptide (TPR) repeat protein
MSTARRSPSWIAVALFVATAALYAPTIGHQFAMLDDWTTLVENPRFDPPSVASIAYYWGHPHMGLWVPVTYTVWGGLAMATYVPTPDEIGVHLDPHVFHAASVLVHGLAVVAAYVLLRRLLRARSAATPDDDEASVNWAAASGALLYAVHPLQVEGVAWTSGLKDVLYSALSLAALLLYLRAAETSAHPRSFSGGPEGRAELRGDARSIFSSRTYWLGALCLLLALLSKPTAMVTPILAAAIDGIVLRRPWRRVAAAVLPWLALAVPVMVVAKVVQPGTGAWVPPPWQRPTVAADSLAFYLGKLMVPIRLAPDYGLRPEVVVRQPWFWIAWLAPMAIGVALWRTREPMLKAAGVFFVIAAAPTLGLVPFEFQYFSNVADHYLQLATFGAAMAIAWVAWRYRSAVARGVIVVLLCVWAVLNVRQQGYWRDTVSLFRHTLDVNPRSYLAHADLAAYADRGHDYATSEREYRAAIAANPQMLIPHANLAIVLALQGRADEALAAARGEIEANAALPPEKRADLREAYFLLGMALFNSGHMAEAVPFFEKQLELTPEHAGVREALGEAKKLLATTRPATGP